MKIFFYKTHNGRTPIEDFIFDLPKSDQAKILASLANVEELGLSCPRVQFRQIRGKLWEIKIRATDSSYRIFYVMINNDKMVLLHLYKKQSQKAPTKEIEIAERRMMEIIKDDKFN